MHFHFCIVKQIENRVTIVRNGQKTKWSKQNQIIKQPAHIFRRNYRFSLSLYAHLPIILRHFK